MHVVVRKSAEKLDAIEQLLFQLPELPDFGNMGGLCREPPRFMRRRTCDPTRSCPELALPPAGPHEDEWLMVCRNEDDADGRGPRSNKLQSALGFDAHTK
eukprot:GHVT01048207.1.p1 GENE.GHVT01048207.1~~GHVT01048207.1.p1  ORF type:complete len:100 (+),score=9.06 GHVT01048207.1:1411-1710(+)